LLDLRCAGLDVHKKTVVGCVLITRPDGPIQREVRTFSTMTVDLLALGDWLDTLQVRMVALESTGVYWRPVFNLLEEGRTLILVNPQHRKRSPWTQNGRQSEPSGWPTSCAMGSHAQLYSAPTDPRAARTHALPQNPGGGTGSGSEPDPEGLGRGQYQARLGGHRCGSARADVPCWKPSSPGSRTLPSWPSSLVGACGPSATSCSWPSQGRLLAQHRTVLKHLLAHIDFLDQSSALLEAELERALAPFGQAVSLAQTRPW
jgi:transposase